jgi:uncharacterized protein (TIGR00369 family)
VHRLDSSSLGFVSTELARPSGDHQGLDVEFAFDDETQTVSASFQVDPAFAAAPTYAHGGVTLAVIDEAMAWAAIAVGRQFAVTQRTSVDFLRPVRIGRPYRVEARVDEMEEGGVLELSAVLRDEKEQICAEATGRFVQLSTDQAPSVAGGGD